MSTRKLQRQARWSRVSSGLLALLCICGAAARAQSNQAAEYQLKAAFLFDFAKFIDWPPSAFAGAQSPFTICIIGRDPFGSFFDEYVADKTIDSRPALIERFASFKLPAGTRCQIAFISASEQFHYRDVIASFSGQSTLLVGDAGGFASSGGAIEFLLEENHIRFAINPEAADRADLKVSSKLLALAQIVHDDRDRGRN
ncbi:MAG TPA: YfiR family protein [Candidatus Aquilonibacter sp.]|nr:YfiR family protein [Candidatus Aquilonibacter sp.]